MDDKDLIAKISLLKSVKPQDDWVILTRREILGEKRPVPSMPLPKKAFSAIFEDIRRVFRLYIAKPALVMTSLALVVFGGAVWHVSAKSLPGDTLYSLKAAAQELPLTFSSAEERPFLELELAQKRLDDLKRVAEANKVRNLPSAIEAFESNAEKASKSLAQIVENQPARALQAGRGVVQLQKEKSAVEQILGTKIGEDQEEAFESTTKQLVENELADLQNRSLTEKQQELYETAKEAYEQENYEQALENIWDLYRSEE